MGTGEKSSKSLSATGLHIAIIASRYNPQVCEGLLSGALQELARLGLPKEKVPIHRVPGAFELPFLAKLLAEQNQVDALICLGAVIRGETAHFDYVCAGATQGLQQAMLTTGIPIAFGLLTTDTAEQAMARASDNEHNKGLEAAQTAVEMAQKRRAILGVRS
jgi:6,7-dimethyl-8-ribityllumazine synthase